MHAHVQGRLDEAQLAAKLGRPEVGEPGEDLAGGLGGDVAGRADDGAAETSDEHDRPRVGDEPGELLGVRRGRRRELRQQPGQRLAQFVGGFGGDLDDGTHGR